MNCIKCGREIEEGKVFCPSCLEVMAKYPVKPGIAIQLPHKKEAPVLKKIHPRRRQSAAPEEQIRTLKKWLKRMVILWLVTMMLLAATIYPAVKYFLERNIPLPGQNYTTVTDAAPGQP